MPEGANSWGKVDAVCAICHSAKSSTAGWDGDEDESENTTSKFITCSVIVIIIVLQI